MKLKIGNLVVLVAIVVTSAVAGVHNQLTKATAFQTQLETAQLNSRLKDLGYYD